MKNRAHYSYRLLLPSFLLRNYELSNDIPHASKTRRHNTIFSSVEDDLVEVR